MTIAPDYDDYVIGCRNITVLIGAKAYKIYKINTHASNIPNGDS